MNRTRRRLWLAVTVTLLIAGGAALWRFVDRGGTSAMSSARLAQGQQIYAEACAACHGARLEGQPDWRNRKLDGKLPAPPHDASGHTWHHGDGDLFALTKYGPAPFAPPGYRSDMPAFAETLSDEQIRDVLAYIKSTWPPEIQARQAAITAQSRAK